MISEIEILESPKGSGYHVFLGLYYQISPAMWNVLRRAWKDDPNRFFVDIDAKSQTTRDVMFREKIAYKNGQILFVFTETPMFKFIRVAPLDNIWQVNNLQTMEQKRVCLSEASSLAVITRDMSQQEALQQ